ncbi:MAG: enoyl-CoA hydratase-related protein [Bacteroidia bacterium]
MNSLVLYHVQDRVGYITLNRPEKRNALSYELIDVLRQTFQTALFDPGCKVVVLQANGDAFCAGADLAYLQQLQNFSHEENLADSRHLMELFKLIYSFPKLVITKVNGAALAGGCGLATVGDFCFAGSGSTFGYTEVKIGFIPALVMVFLTRRISGSIVRQLLLTGDVIPAERALHMGLIQEVVDPGKLEETVHHYATHLARTTSAQSVATIKQMLCEIPSLSIDDGLEFAAKMNANARSEEDCKKGIAAFLNKQKLSW